MFNMLRFGRITKFPSNSPYRQQQGQVVVLFVIGLMALVLTLSLIFNTGHQVRTKAKVQDAVDAAAISQGAMVARSLNAMSMNNVAITQAFTLQTLMTALIPELTATSIETGKKWLDYTEKVLTNCPACGTLNPVACVRCAINSYRLADATLIAYDLLKIWGDLGVSLNPASLINDPPLPPKKITIATQITLALESMNQQLVDGFLQSSKKMSQQLAELNGLNEPPIYIGDGAYGKLKKSEDYYGIKLPVVKTNPIGGTFNFSDVNVLSKLQDYSLCITGTKGSPTNFPQTFWNMQEHGYPIGRGPFLIGKDSFEAEIGPLVDDIEGFPHFGDVADATDFDRIWADFLWTVGCISQSMVDISLDISDSGINVLTSPIKRIDLYKVNKPYAIPSVGNLGGSADDWSILAIGRKKADTGVLGKATFPNPVEGHYAYAQVEVYNPVWYDLYTQDWSAKLIPASDLTKPNNSLHNIIKKYYPELAEVIKNPIANETSRYNTH